MDKRTTLKRDEASSRSRGGGIGNLSNLKVSAASISCGDPVMRTKMSQARVEGVAQ